VASVDSFLSASLLRDDRKYFSIIRFLIWRVWPGKQGPFATEATYATFDRLTHGCTRDATSAFPSSGHACRVGLGSFVPTTDIIERFGRPMARSPMERRRCAPMTPVRAEYGRRRLFPGTQPLPRSRDRQPGVDIRSRMPTSGRSATCLPEARSRNRLVARGDALI
jgi:hypothetical protein